jgi:hypothetical protein
MTPLPKLSLIGANPDPSAVNLVNRFNRRDTKFRQPWIGPNNWYLRYGDSASVPEYASGLSRPLLKATKPIVSEHMGAEVRFYGDSQ